MATNESKTSSENDQPQDLSKKTTDIKENTTKTTPEQPTRIHGKREQPEVLCSCPQKCDGRVSSEARARLYQHFGRLRDHAAQNAYLQSYIEMRSVYRRLWAEEERVRGRLPRRVSCKYRIPVSDLPPVTSLDLPKPRLITNSKGKATFVMTPRGKGKTIEVCQKAFMNVYGITEKRVRLQREKLIARLRDRSPPPLVSPPPPIAPAHPAGQVRLITLAQQEMNHSETREDINQNVKTYQQQQQEEQETLAVAIVDSFFQNQLWKPEYIGIPKDKFEHIKV